MDLVTFTEEILNDKLHFLCSECYSNLNEKNVIDNKKFWKTVKPFLLDKTVNSSSITLVENYEILREETITTETFNTFFTNIVTNLKVPPYISSDFKETFKNVDDAVTAIIEKYKKTQI